MVAQCFKNRKVNIFLFRQFAVIQLYVEDCFCCLIIFLTGSFDVFCYSEKNWDHFLFTISAPVFFRLMIILGFQNFKKKTFLLIWVNGTYRFVTPLYVHEPAGLFLWIASFWVGIDIIHCFSLFRTKRMHDLGRQCMTWVANAWLGYQI
jgi:hypothetical protein